jgi:hypothetical protein
MHQLVEERRNNNVEGSQHLIRFRAYRIMMKRLRYRVYLELCDIGSLWDAMRKNITPYPRQKHYEHVAKWMNPDILIPEKYLWYIFRALVDACIALQNGGKEKLTHLDLCSLSNILLRMDTKIKVRQRALLVLLSCQSCH